MSNMSYCRFENTYKDLNIVKKIKGINVRITIFARKRD